MLHQDPKLHVEAFQFLRVALGIPPVAPEGVEIHQVHEAESVEFFLCDLNGLLHPVDAALRLPGAGDAVAVEDILDLPDAPHVQARVLQCVQRRGVRRFQSIVVAVRCADELARLFPDVGAGDDPAHLPLLAHGQLPGDLTVPVQVFQSGGLLISADLEHGIRRGVYDQLAFIDLLLCHLIQDLCAAGRLVPDDLLSCPLLQLRDELRRETVLRKGLEGLFGVDAHHLPVSGHGILAAALLPEDAVASQRRGDRLHLGELLQIADPQLPEIRDLQMGGRVRDMAQSIRTVISEIRGILRASDPQGIQHDDKDPLIRNDLAVSAHSTPPFFSSSFTSFTILLVPRRSAPSSTNRSASSRLEMPPAALIFTPFPT